MNYKLLPEDFIAKMPERTQTRFLITIFLRVCLQVSFLVCEGENAFLTGMQNVNKMDVEHSFYRL